MATSNTALQVADLDFFTIKENLKNFLRSQSTFTDYDFEGSGMSVLLDVLAYNTYYNSFYLNMAANESFLDTAQVRNNILSHAKLINYVPDSPHGSVSLVNVIVSPSTTEDRDTNVITLEKYTKLVGQDKNGINYPYVTLNSNTSYKSGDVFSFANLFPRDTFRIDYIRNGKLEAHIKKSYLSGDVANSKLQKAKALKDLTFDFSGLKFTGKTINDNLLVGLITSRPLHVQINLGSTFKKIDVYYVDYLCVNKIWRKKNIAPQLIQTHEYNQSHSNRKICVSLFKREEELTGIIPLTVYKTYCFPLREKNWWSPEQLDARIKILTGDKQNMYYLYNFLNELKNEKNNVFLASNY